MAVLKCTTCFEEYPWCECKGIAGFTLWIETVEIFNCYHNDRVYLPTIQECSPYLKEIELRKLTPSQEYVDTSSVNFFVKKIFNGTQPDLKSFVNTESKGGIRVYADMDGIFIVDGHHRLSAMILAGIPKAPLWYSESARSILS